MAFRGEAGVTPLHTWDRDIIYKQTMNYDPLTKDKTLPPR